MLIGFGSFNQAVEHGAGAGAFDGVAEEPVLAADDKRSDRILCWVVVDRPLAVLDISSELAPIFLCIGNRLAELAFGQDTVLCFIQPLFELLQQRQALLLAGLMASGAVALFVLLLDGVEFGDVIEISVNRT